MNSNAAIRSRLPELAIIPSSIFYHREKHLFKKRTMKEKNMTYIPFRGKDQGVILQDRKGSFLSYNAFVRKMFAPVKGKNIFSGTTFYDEFGGIIAPGFYPPNQVLSDFSRMAELKAKLTNKRTALEKWFLVRSFAYIHDANPFVLTILYPSEKPILGPHKEDAISFIGHELKSHLTNIKAYAQLLAHNAKKIAETKRVDYLQKIDSQVDQLTLMVIELLESARILQGKMRLQMSTIDLYTVVASAVALVSAQFGGHTITFSCKKGIFIKADEYRLATVFRHLLNNAVSFSEKNQPVFLSVRRRKNEIICRVIDKGTGMNASELSHIYTPFFKGQRGESQDRKLGVGCFLSRGIVLAHGGSMDVSSKKKKGTTVTVRLPVHAYE